MLLVFAFAVIGASNPQLGSKVSSAKREGVDIIIDLDVSNSMLSEDVKPSRIERAKQYIYRLLDKLENDRIGIVIFAGDAFVQMPLTTDFAAAKLFLSDVSPDLVETQGTAIGRAIELSMESFQTGDDKKKAIIIITDGENHEDNAIEMASKAEKEGFIIHTIGVGSLDGAPIPMYNNGQRVGFRKDNQGNTILTKLDEVTMEKIASAGNGRFILAGDNDPDLPKLVEDLSGMKKTEFQSKIYSEYESRFQYVYAVIFILLLIEFFISERRNKFFDILNLFGEKKE